MAEIIKHNVLSEFKKFHDLLIDDLKKYKLTYLEAQQRCDDLWKLIPNNFDVNTVVLNELMKNQFLNDPDWRYSKTYTIKKQ